MSLSSAQIASQSAARIAGSSPSPAAAPGAAKAGRPGGDPFADLMKSELQQVNHQHQHADEMVKQLVEGQTDNIHGVVLSVAKADLAFRMMLEIRNRVIDSYQEVMRMQV